MFDTQEVLKRLTFEAHGNRVVFKNVWFLFAEDPTSEVPEEVLLVAQSIGGNYGLMMSGADVATYIAHLLNTAKERENE